MKAYLLFDNVNPKKLIGIFSSEDKAKDFTTDGEYWIIPAEVNQLYDDLSSEGLPGAILFLQEGLSTQLQQLDVKLENFKSIAQDRFNQLQTSLDNLDIRVSSLEGG